MRLTEYPEVVRACVLCALAREDRHAWVRADGLGCLPFAPPALEEALGQLCADGCAESLQWPHEGRPCPHYRATEYGRCLCESLRGQWLREREALDRLLLGPDKAAQRPGGTSAR